MLKRYSFFLIWLLLLVLSCTYTPPFKNENREPLPSLLVHPSPSFSFLSGTLDHSHATDKLTFRVERGLSIQNLDKTKIRYVKMWVWGPGIAQKVWNANAFVAVDLNKGAELEIDGVPKGQNRLVTALAYDQNQEWIPGALLRGYYSSSAGQEKVRLTLSWRFNPLGGALETLLAKGFPLLHSLNLAQIQANIDQVIYGGAAPVTPFVVHPSRVSSQSLVTLLEQGVIPTPSQIVPPSPTTDIVIQNPQGGPLTRDITLVVNDPSSPTFVVNAGTDRTTLSNIAIGTWSAVAKITTPNGVVQASLTVTVDESGNIALSKGTALNPLIMPPVITTVDNTYHTPAYAGLVGWWKGNGNPNDSLGSNHGTLFGNTTYALDKVGQSFQLDGNGDYVKIAPAAPLVMSNALSISVWIYPTGVAPAGCTIAAAPIVNKEGEYMVAQLGTGNIAWLLANTAPSWSTWIDTGYNAPQNQWTHLVMVYNNVSGRADTYANGTLVHSIAANGTIGDFWPAANELRIGGRQQCPASDFFPGRIDELQLYNRALLAPEVQALYAIKNITIQGDGFDTTPGNNTVTLGATPVTVTKATATTLTVAVPPTMFGLQTVNVTTNTQNSFQATVNILPAIDAISSKLVKVGDSITINGSNFEPGNTTVKFNGITAAVSAVTSTSLTATVPVGATDGSVTLATSGGTATGPNFTMVPPGLVAWWKLDEGAGVAAIDFSGNGNNGTINGGPTWTPGATCKSGRCMNFDGVNDVVVVDTPVGIPFGNGNRTVLAWLYPIATTTMWGVVQSGNMDCNSLMFGMAYHGPAAFWGGCNDFISTLNSPLNQWFFEAIVYNGSQVQVWGNASFETATVGALNTQASKIFLGGETTNNGASFRNRFNGRLNHVQMYNRALTPAEITAVYNATN